MSAWMVEDERVAAIAKESRQRKAEQRLALATG
jgi:hypothetical protein